METRVKISINISYSACRSPKRTEANRRQKHNKYIYNKSTCTTIIWHRPCEGWVFNHWPVPMEAWVQSQASQWGIYGGHSITKTGISPTTSVFPCQYHSANAPYSFI